MDTSRKTAIVVGIFYIAANVAGILRNRSQITSDTWYNPTSGKRDGGSNDNQDGTSMSM